MKSLHNSEMVGSRKLQDLFRERSATKDQE